MGVASQPNREMTKKEQRVAIWQKYNGHCAYCGKELAFKEMQVDHYFPQWSPHIAKMWGKMEVDDFRNLMPSCRRCNHYKRAYLPEDFRKMIKTLHERVLKIYIAKVAEDFGIITIHPFDGVFYFEKCNQIEKR